jgi:uncharacterized protein YbjT (DUF2867 family)
MTKHTAHLENVAKAMAGESFSYPTHNVFATGDNSLLDPSDTALVGEIGSREAVTTARIGSAITWTSVRSGTDVVDTANGDNLTAVSLDIASTGGSTQLSTVIDELQTTAFDLELNWNWEVN